MPPKRKKPGVKCGICNITFPSRKAWTKRSQCPGCARAVKVLITQDVRRKNEAPIAGTEERVEKYRRRVEAGQRIFEETPS